MGLLDDAIARQNQKRIFRMGELNKAAKREANRQKFGTFIGRNLLDGTAIVLLDGDITPTSGFRLISNANVVNGDRVAIRKTEGLWRADALNVREIAPEIIVPEKKVILVDNAFVFSFALVADLRVDLITYDEFGDVDQSGSYQRRLAIANGLSGLNTAKNLVYSDPERILVNKLLIGANITVNSTGGQALQVNSFTPGVDPIWATYELNAFSVFRGELRTSEFSFSSTPIAKLTQINFNIFSVVDGTFTLTPLPPYAYDITFSASNFYLVPIIDSSSILLSDGLPIVRVDSGILWDGEVYGTGDTLLRSWSNLDGIYPYSEVDINAGGIPIDDMYDGEIRDVDYWWRYRRTGATNWYDL